MADKSELHATVPAKRINVEGSRPTVESEPEVLLNTVGPYASPS